MNIYRTGKKIRNYFRRSVKKRIFSEGFIAGLLAGIALKTGIDIEKGGFILKMVEFFCTSTTNGFDCAGLIGFLSFGIILFTTVSLYYEIRKVRNRRILGIKFKGWFLGILIYLSAFLLSFILILLL